MIINLSPIVSFVEKHRAKFYFVLSLSLIFLVLRNPIIAWDTLAYHIPFAAKLMKLQNYQDFSLISDYYREQIFHRYDGFPMFPYFLQGIIYSATGSLKYLVLISVLSFLLFVYSAKKLFNVKPVFLAVTCLSVPLIAIHIHSSYIDLYCGVLISLLTLVTIRICDYSEPPKLNYIFAFGILSLICGQSKIFTLPFVYLLSVFNIFMVYRSTLAKNLKRNLILFFALA